MKKIVYYILFILSFLSFCSVSALETEYNTETNVKKAILVEDYIVRHKWKVEEFIDKYNITNNWSLNNDIIELEESIEALKKIQNTDIHKEAAEEIIQAVIKRIKRVNENLKIKLKEEKLRFEKELNTKKNTYSKLWIKLSDKIDSINLKVAKNIFKDKTILSLKESKIKQNLINLNKESLKLRNFWNFVFTSEKEIKDSFIRILKNIKREVASMKEQLK